MLSAVVSLLVPLALTTSPNPATPPSYHQVQAYVTGYNTVVGQTDSTPCIGASGKDICGRHDAVACPRRIGLGTVVEIRGTTYVCEDRLARKFDKRFDISCDKDVSCPPEVTGWAWIKVFDRPILAGSNGHQAQAGVTRLWRERPMLVASRAASSRRKTPFVRHASNSWARAWRISRG